MPSTAYSFYDVAKDFQPAITALIALTAAVIAATAAYIVGMAKVRFDERTAEQQHVRQRLALVIRLRFEVARIYSLAMSMKAGAARIAARLAVSSKDPDTFSTLSSGFETFLVTPAGDEAWLRLDLFPLDLAKDLDALRRRLMIIQYDFASTRGYPPGDGMESIMTDIASACPPVAEKLDSLITEINTQLEPLKLSRHRLFSSKPLTVK